MYKKKTLRHMQPVTRHYARNLNSLQGILKRLQNLTEDIARLELDSTALFAHNWQRAGELHQHNGAELEKRIDAAEIFYDPALKDVHPEILPGRIHWEKADEVHAIHDPQTGETQILPGKEDVCPPTE